LRARQSRKQRGEFAVEIVIAGSRVEIRGLSCLSLSQTFGCGQCFRWQENRDLPLPEDTSVYAGDRMFFGVAGEQALCIVQNENRVVLYTEPELFQSFWRPYFDLDRDYESLRDSFQPDAALKRAMDCAGGIRILRQPFFEVLITFLFSQNNHIPRIRSMVESLCALFGEEREYRGRTYRAFPTAEKLAALTPEDLAPVRAGYRAAYIPAAARWVAEGRISEEELRRLPTADAREKLMRLRGGGPKVADCVLLFGLGHLNAFPVDVWMKRILKEQYGTETPEGFGAFGGLLQQYLFYYGKFIRGSGKNFRGNN
jgi:N-glycosylase/DNA lyase